MTVMEIPRVRRRQAKPIAILHGAVGADAGPDEQDVLVEVDCIRRALVALGHRPLPVPLTLDLEAARRRLLQVRPALVFNLVESLDGNGALIHLATSLLDALGIPYTGAQTDAMFLTSSKLVAKRIMRAAGIPTAPWWEPQGGSPLPDFAGPYIVKSVWEHASIGIDDTSVTADRRVAAAVLRKRRRALGGQWFVERYIDGREFNIGLLGGPTDGGIVPQILPMAEMQFVDFPAGKPRIVGYTAKWHDGSFEERHTQRDFDWSAREPELLARLEQVARDTWRLFRMSGYARVDMRVDAAGEPFVLEINANPCLSPDAGFMAAAERVGLRAVDVVARILAATKPAAPMRPAVHKADAGSAIRPH
jgi:D-alanine-D-alanine ligase